MTDPPNHPDGLTIRPFREDDSPGVIALWSAVFPDDPPRNDPGKIIRRKLAVQRDLFLVGERDGRIVSAVMAGYDGHRAWIYHLAVGPGRRRQGIGAAMMAEAERRLRAMGCPKINLQVLRPNIGVVRFYESLGYAVEDRVCLGKLLE
jgi:ribosomal protein S18 acetylase RimI-like enzyme